MNPTETKSNPEILPGQRVFIVGGSGTGKTTLAKTILREIPQYYVVIDSKHEIDGKELGSRKFEYIDTVGDLGKTSPRRSIIYRPDTDEESLDNYEVILDWVYRRGNTCLYVDETMALGNNISYPKSLRAICTRGRTRGVTGIFLSQRPSRIPVEVMSEANHFMIFQTSYPVDKKKMQEMIPPGYNDLLEGDNFPSINHYLYWRNLPRQIPIYRKEKIGNAS